MVTITVDMLAADVINYIHYMGRHVNTVKKLTLKFYKVL
ncbi:unnamed protein product [Thelazia callipaeda]|uniref:Uncharacterized protein n=1 Tax=Thelazia callipaeda TaxID=103827 RepID=A0A0N5D422_THECL|nr:unnamed protein product [Thelazia callipaeda]